MKSPYIAIDSYINIAYGQNPKECLDNYIDEFNEEPVNQLSFYKLEPVKVKSSYEFVITNND